MFADKEKPAAPTTSCIRVMSIIAKAGFFAGLLSLISLMVAVVPVALSLGGVAIICGHISRNRCSKNHELKKDAANALIGLILGYSSICIVLLGLNDRDRQHHPRRAIAMAYALESAVNNYFVEYGVLPNVGGRISTTSPQGLELLHILLGLKENSVNPQNPRQIKFITFREGRNGKNGLIYSESGTTVEGLFDPWGNPFTVILDTDRDELLRFKIAGKDVELKGRRVAVFSPGADQKEGTKDDVRSW